MALKIDPNLCTSCGDCEADCPTESIKPRKGVYVINADTCTECEGDYDKPQCVKVCPVDNCIVAV